MIKLLNKYITDWFMVIYEYITTSYYLVLKPRRTFRYLLNNRERLSISPGLYFFVNIFVIQIITFVSNKTDTQIIGSKEVFEMPFLGHVSASYIFNFIGFYVGACVVLFVFVHLVKNSLEYFDCISKVVLYSSLVTLLLYLLNFCFIKLYTVLLTSLQIIDSPALAELSILDNIIEVNEVFFIIAYTMILTEVTSAIIYLGYMSYLLSTYVPFKCINTIKAIVTFMVFILLIIGSNIFCLGGLYKEISDIYSKINNINVFCLNNNYQSRQIELEKEYFYLSKNKFLSKQDQLRVYKLYLLTKYEKIIPIEEMTDPIYIVNNNYGIPEANEKYVDYLVNHLKYNSELLKLMELKNISDIEKKQYNASSYDIFLKNVSQNKFENQSWLIIPLSLVKILPN